MTVVNIKASTQEEIRFEFDNLKERELNPGPPNAPSRAFSEDSVFYTDKTNVFVTIPDSREVSKSIILKLTITGNSAEQREAVIDCNGRVTKADLNFISVLHASMGRPRNGTKYRQKAEITLNFGNRCETLVCPINGTTTFNMCFYDAYEAQNGKPGSIGSIYAYPDTPVS